MRVLSSVVFLVLFGTMSVAWAECDDPTRNCFEKLNDAARDLKSSDSFSDAWENAKAAGKAARDCINCGMEDVQTKMKQITPSGSGGK